MNDLLRINPRGLPPGDSTNSIDCRAVVIGECLAMAVAQARQMQADTAGDGVLRHFHDGALTDSGIQFQSELALTADNPGAVVRGPIALPRSSKSPRVWIAQLGQEGENAPVFSLQAILKIISIQMPLFFRCENGFKI